jgi:hypothetical protein
MFGAKLLLAIFQLPPPLSGMAEVGGKMRHFLKTIL